MPNLPAMPVADFELHLDTNQVNSSWTWNGPFGQLGHLELIELDPGESIVETSGDIDLSGGGLVFDWVVAEAANYIVRMYSDGYLTYTSDMFLLTPV